jgi:hypothetical protein
LTGADEGGDVDTGKIIRGAFSSKGEPPSASVWPDDRKKVLILAEGSRNQLKVEQAGVGAMGDPTREEFDAKLAAAEARTQTLFTQIDGKIDRLSDNVARLRDEVSDSRKEVAESRKEVRQEANSLRWWMVGTGLFVLLGVIGSVVGILAYGLSSLELGMRSAPPQISVVPVVPTPGEQRPSAVPRASEGGQ